MSANGSGLLVIERILRDRHSIWQQIVEERELNRLTGNMLTSSALALACYGAVLGAFHSVLMALTSAVKLPLLFLVTLAICLPTLYLFNLVFGARLSVRQAAAMVMVAITVTSMLAVAFAPISLFFLITAPDYGFFKLLNVAILSLSVLVGLRFLTGGMQVLNQHGLLAPLAAGQNQSAAPGALAAPTLVPAVPMPGTVPAMVPSQVAVAEPVPAAVNPANGGGPAVAEATPPPPPQVSVPSTGQLQIPPGAYALPADRPGLGRAPARPGAGEQRPASMTLLYIWILLFGFVGTQLAWTLRPFFGSPGEPFAFFRSIEGNFYAEVLRTIAHL